MEPESLVLVSGTYEELDVLAKPTHRRVRLNAQANGFPTRPAASCGDVALPELRSRTVQTPSQSASVMPDNRYWLIRIAADSHGTKYNPYHARTSVGTSASV